MDDPHIPEDLGWTVNTTHITKKAQLRLIFLRSLRRNKLCPLLLKNFYHCTIECVLTYRCMGFSMPAALHLRRNNCSGSSKTVDHWLPASMPGEDLFQPNRLLSRAKRIRNDPAHQGHTLFSSLLAGRLGVLRARTNRMKNSFFAMAVKRLLQDS